MKYYAVRKGLKTGIFTSWDLCKDSVSGFPGAEYKSFKTQEEAEGYMSNDDSSLTSPIPVPKEGEAIVYIKGITKDNKYSFGCVFVKSGNCIKKTLGCGDNSETLAIGSSAGEMIAAMYAAKSLIKSGFKKITIVYYQDIIEKLVTGEWKAKNELTKKYAETMKELIYSAEIFYRKIRKEDSYSMLVSQMAKSAISGQMGIPKVEEVW